MRKPRLAIMDDTFEARMAVRGSIWAVSTYKDIELIASYLVRWLSGWCTVRSSRLRDDEVDRFRLVRLSAKHPGSNF